MRENLQNEKKGLSQAEAERLLKITGKNRLESGKKNSAVRIFANQFHDIMVMILLIAAVISVLLGEYTDAVPIMIIVVVNAVLGFVQEYRCEKTLQRLEELTAPEARVYRDGKLCVIPAEDIVTGDVIELEAGDRVPADAVITYCKNFACDEAVLTGEAVPCEKSAHCGQLEINLLNLPYMVYMGTVCTRGTARAEVISTGKLTQMGRVSSMIGKIEPELTPLQKKLGELGRTLALICLGVCVLVFAAGVLRGEPVLDMLMTGITIAIAAIPEGLPAAVTIALALAVRKMLKRNALVHRLHSVETLGCASVICTDKTGTITMNRMSVKKLCTFGETESEYTFSDNESGAAAQNGRLCNAWDYSGLNEILTCACACNNAVTVQPKPMHGRNRGVTSVRIEGDPTETAILEACIKCGIDTEHFNLRRIDEQPFESENRFMSVTCEDGRGERTVYKKGAQDVILGECGYVLTDDGSGLIPITESKRAGIAARADSLAAEGARVLAFSKIFKARCVFLGLVAISDPPRPEAEKAVKECRKAGIKTVMITGDHKLTACAVARQTGILRQGELALTGRELDEMSDERLSEIINNVSVFARVTPAHKLRIVKAFKDKGNVCAMTGDGVNDAPAIKEASIGVAMGVSGTDVTKQAADCILLDDNFATLVNAVEEGRTIYQNIRKFVRYLISCNIGEVLTMLGGIIMGLPMVLVPAQILLVNLVTDGLPAVALGVEPTEPSVMKKPPRKETDSFFGGGLLTRIIARGILIGLCTLAAFTVLLKLGSALEAARTGALITLIFSQLIHVFECKSEEKSLLQIPLFSNPYLVVAVAVSVICLALCMYIPVLGSVFALSRLSVTQWLVSVGFSAAVPIFAAVFKRKI